jgi:hypothetical protein
MKKLMILLGLSMLLLAAIAGWQIAACYVANSELASDMQDLAAQNPARIGVASFDTEEELRSAVIASAKEHGIPLVPEQVTVRRVVTPGIVTPGLPTPNSTKPGALDISLSADYRAQVSVLGLSFPIRFTPSGSHRGEVDLK